LARGEERGTLNPASGEKLRGKRIGPHSHVTRGPQKTRTEENELAIGAAEVSGRSGSERAVRVKLQSTSASTGVDREDRGGKRTNHSKNVGGKICVKRAIGGGCTFGPMERRREKKEIRDCVQEFRDLRRGRTLPLIHEGCPGG